MFAGLHQESFVLRLAPADVKAFLEIDGAKPFEPMPGRSMAGYVVVPESMLANSADLKKWLEKSFAYASSLPPKQAKAKAKKPKEHG